MLLHFEIREHDGEAHRWWVPGREGKTPATVLYSAVFPLSDPEAFKCTVYHPTHYHPATLPGAVVDRDAFATLLSDNYADPYFSLRVDCAAIHVPTGRVAAVLE